jgi:transposase
MVVDGHGTPLAYLLASASPAEIRLLEPTLDQLAPHLYPEKLIGDRAYDSDQHDARVLDAYGIELVSPHRTNRRRHATQDGRPLRRYKRRWKVERTFAWLSNFRRLTNRWERHADAYGGFLSLACILLTLRRF